jgi:sarcosine oxidase gamma subunit
VIGSSADGFAGRPLQAAVEVFALDARGSRAVARLHEAVSAASADPGSAPRWSALLPTAPDRWLWLEPEPERLAELVEAGLIVVDVEGKWNVYTAEAVAARRVLRTALDVDEALRGRRCATVTLFDCPAVLAQAAAGDWIVCVRASYATSFEYACGLAVRGDS